MSNEEFEDTFKAPPPAAILRRPKPKHPKGFEPGFEWDGESGYINTGPLPERPRTWDQFIMDSGLDPNEVQVVGPVQIRGWDNNLGRDPKTGEESVMRFHYYKLNVEKIAPDDKLDFPSLFKMARTKKREPKQPAALEDKTVFVAWADPQTGKVGSRGGTKELIARFGDIQAELKDYCKVQKARHAIWGDIGDLVESIENTSQQAHTNDLSLMRQIEVGTDLEFAGIDLLAKLHASVGVLSVGSNHCRWRQGKNDLGKPIDDWGVHVLRQIQKAMRLNSNYEHVNFHYPKDWDESLAVEASGLIVGVAHGHQVSNMNLIPKWWGEQVHGGQPVAHADILVTGHWHNFRAQTTGRNSWTGRSKWWFGAPTVDNGSDWFRNKAGSDSDPALLVFTVDKNGWGNMQLLGKPDPIVDLEEFASRSYDM